MRGVTSRTESISGQQIVRPQRPPAQTARRADNLRPDFKSVLERAVAGVKFSKHAASRLAEAPALTTAQLADVRRAIELASTKGARQSLVLLDDLALVVSVRNRTVITAIAENRMRDRVITNIDSAVILRSGPDLDEGAPGGRNDGSPLESTSPRRSMNR